jgi:hypothetical protein
MTGYLVVVSCGEEKVWKRHPGAGPTPAQDAYTSSRFNKSREYAEHFGERWLILSAKYGLIEPDFVIPADYNRSFYDPDAISLALLREQVAAKELERFRTVGVLGSEIYWRRVVSAFETCRVRVKHVNGNISFPPLFHALINRLLESGTPFREDL